MATEFDSFDEATRALLLSTCEVLGDQLEFVIAGGWVPILRGNIEGILHPGTRDVDVLLSDTSTNVEDALKRFLKGPFTPSAKHEFQVMRPLCVGKRHYMFNVDLMHPKEQTEKPSLFVDHFDMGTFDAYDPSGKRWLKSIAFASAAIVFKKRLWSNVVVRGKDALGVDKEICVPLLNEEAFILSKAESLKSPKRTRDAFDVYYILCGDKGEETSKRLRTLIEEDEDVAERVEQMKRWIEQNRDLFDGHVETHARKQVPAANEVLARLTG